MDVVDKVLYVAVTLLIGMAGLIAGYSLKDDKDDSSARIQKKEQPEPEYYVNYDACKPHGGFLTYKDKLWKEVFVRASDGYLYCQDGSVVTVPPYQAHAESVYVDPD